MVFLIGMCNNRPLLVHNWLPVVFAMPRMLKELSGQPELGMLQAQTFVSGLAILAVQYWRSFEHLRAYAHAKNLEHLPAWADFNRKVGGNGSVSIYHETYLVGAGEYEAIYANMPPFGLTKAGERVPATGRMRDAKSGLSGG